jgi:hypothetical protein
MTAKRSFFKTAAISTALMLGGGATITTVEAQSDNAGVNEANPKKYFAMVACKTPKNDIYGRLVTPEETTDIWRCTGSGEPWEITVDGVTTKVWAGKLAEFGTYYESGFGFYSSEGLEEIAIPYVTTMNEEISLLVFDTSTKERAHFSYSCGGFERVGGPDCARWGLGFLRFQPSAPKIDMPATWHSSMRYSHAGSSTTESFNADAIPERENCGEYVFSVTGLELCPGLSQSAVSSVIGEPADCNQTPNNVGTMCTYENAKYGDTPAKVVATYRHGLLIRADYFLDKDQNVSQLPIVFETLLGSPYEKQGDSRLWQEKSQVLAYDPQSSRPLVKVFVLDNAAWEEMTKLEKNLAVKTPSGGSTNDTVSASTPESEAIRNLASGLKRPRSIFGQKRELIEIFA